MKNKLRIFAVWFALAAPVITSCKERSWITLSDDGGWCWFQDERAIIHDGTLVVGTVAAGVHDPRRKGDVEALVLDLVSRKISIVTLHEKIGLDDHNAPAFEELGDGRILAIFATHGRVNTFWQRISEPNDPLNWQAVRQYVPTKKSRITYSNVFRLSAENDRLYNFYRGYDNSNKPSYAYSNDLGETWRNGGVVIRVPTKARHRPYVKYASNRRDTIHLLYTEGHPRNYNNSLYHLFYRGGRLHRSDGTVIATLQEGLERPELGTRVFQGDEKNVAWPCDVHLDDAGRPVVVYSVQKDPRNLKPGLPESGQDHRYRYARWDGREWHDHEIAFAGTRLYPREDDYTGLACIDPDRTNEVYISSDADPVSGKALISRADGKRHYEIFKGVTPDGGASWKWSPITKNSSVDNLRPIVPRWNKRRRALLWLRGTLNTYTNYDLDVVGLIDRP